MAPAPVHLGTDQIQHIEQPSTLIRTAAVKRTYAADTDYWYCWPGANLQTQTGTETIYCEPDVVQYQYRYQDRF